MKSIIIFCIAIIYTAMAVNAQLQVEQDGDVAIGNYSPTSRLTISDTKATELKTYAVGGYLKAANWTMNNTYSYGFGISSEYGYIWRDVNSPQSIMTFSQSGQVGVGEPPSAQLSINSSSDPFRVRRSGSTKLFVASNGGVNVGYWAANANENCLYVYGTITEGSDKAFKENIQPITSSLSKINKLRGVSYNRKIFNENEGLNIKSLGESDYVLSKEKELGFIAQEVEKILPEVVNTSADGSKGIMYSRLIAVLVEAVKEQQLQIEELKNSMTALSVSNNSSKNSNLYPNPVNLEANLNLSIPGSVKKAMLNIYNAEGKLIKQIKIKDRGDSVITFDTSDLSAGIYTYSLTTDGNIISSNRMIKE